MADISVQTQSRQATSPNRGRRRPRGRGPSRGGRGGAKTKGDSTPDPNAQAMDGVNLKTDVDTAAAADVTASQTEAQEDDNQDLCWICAEPVKYYAVSECNHRTCHICALRLRALYKKLDCTFCKEPQPTVIFTVSPDAPFASYAPDAISFQDVKLAISFETQEIMEESLLLLRFNCPDSSCDYIATGWNDLKLHARGNHSKLMCDLCIRHKKVFPHEHALYTSPQLSTHLPSMQRRQQKSAPKDQVEGGVHPLCEFCRECLFGDDELYTHMRHTHEECFICKRNEIRDKYFQNYEALEQHFEQAHHLCPNPSCQASKFVVFGSRIDLQAHMMEEHGAEMSTRDKKDARRVDAAFEFQDASSGSNRRRGGGPTGSGGGGRDREQRDPLAPRPVSGLESRRNRFGAHLTTEGDANDLSPGPSRHQTPSPPPPSMDPITGERYTAIFVRLRNLAPHPINAIAGVKLALRDYTASQSGARDLISTIWNILDRDLDATASIVNLIVDFLEDEEKKTALLSAWNEFKVERRREFPDLMPTSVGTDYAGIADGRTLNAATARRAAGPRHTQRAVWDRVAQAAERGASFPALRTPRARQPQAVAPPRAQHTATGPTPNFRKQSARNTAWSASAAGVSGGGGGNNNNGNGASVSSQGGGRPPAAPPPPAPPLTDSAFPTLPGSAAPRARPIVSARTGQLQHILGSAPPSTSAWAPGRTAQDEVAGGREGEEVAIAAEASPAPGGKKKGKQKQKQMLFMLGSTGRQE
ncbi:hypothetical protein EDB86DRAFT_567986 [Lactarius hatsudake]|nr:hypothetical protein EDB86DRAFT_567986 [Lactarius hatsudake]